jgi:zinc transport system substrate-binding protein
VAVAAGLALALTVMLCACGRDEEDAGERTTVVAAFYPLAWAAEQVANDNVDVVNLTPAGAEPHDIELTAGDVERVRDADLVLYLGEGFMPALEEAIDGRENAIDLLSGQELRAGGDERAHESNPDEPAGREDEDPATDPHVWLDPIRLAAIARTVAAELGEAEAGRQVVAELDELDEDFREALAQCKRREIVTSHAAFGYLADRYGLEQIALTGVSPEAEPSPRALEKLVDEVEEVGATTVFFETLVSPRLAETVAREAGAKTAALDPLEGLEEDELDAGADYFSVMRDNLRTLREALGCR